eukprot:TRINITY_DN12371_c0_g1_i4.p1 TRINITY_DN12371_c0_g1~~TRINITY_DN12371_c0_g1_i4.p1  ORF type:complete len:308 (+),score=53.60 TRINITY_DN12371_c0_g1_i4:87-1010(+)
MLRSLVGSEMCIRDSINAEYGEELVARMEGMSSFPPMRGNARYTSMAADQPQTSEVKGPEDDPQPQPGEVVEAGEAKGDLLLDGDVSPSKTWFRMIDLRVCDVGTWNGTYEFAMLPLIVLVGIQFGTGVLMVTLASVYYDQCQVAANYMLASGLCWMFAAFAVTASWWTLRGTSAGAEFRHLDPASMFWHRPGTRRILLGLTAVLGTCLQLFSAALTIDTAGLLYVLVDSSHGAVELGGQYCSLHQELIKSLGAPACLVLLTWGLSVGFFCNWIDMELRACGLRSYKACCFKPVSYTHLTLPTKRIV